MTRKTQEEHDADHAVRVKVWVTFVLVLATLGMLYMPEGSVWYSFVSSLFWVWRN
jgi:hypothetical protein